MSHQPTPGVMPALVCKYRLHKNPLIFMFQGAKINRKRGNHIPDVEHNRMIPTCLDKTKQGLNSLNAEITTRLRHDQWYNNFKAYAEAIKQKFRFFL